MLVRCISTGVLGVTGPSGADMVDNTSVHILCVGGGGVVCLFAYVHTHNM